MISFLLIIFELNKGNIPIYRSRDRSSLRKRNLVPPSPSPYPFGWLFATLSITDDELLYMAGLDAYVLIRYILLNMKFSLFLILVGVTVLVPIYSTSGGDLHGWNSLTIANISVSEEEDNSRRLWAPVVCAYIAAYYFCYLLKEEYVNFIQKRIQYFAEGDHVTPIQTNYTVMFEEIPEELRSPIAFQSFLKNLFPDSVFCFEMMLKVKDLDRTSKRKVDVRLQLERAIAHYCATGERLKMDVCTDKADKGLEEGDFTPLVQVQKEQMDSESSSSTPSSYEAPTVIRARAASDSVSSETSTHEINPKIQLRETNSANVTDINVANTTPSNPSISDVEKGQQVPSTSSSSRVKYNRSHVLNDTTTLTCTSFCSTLGCLHPSVSVDAINYLRLLLNALNERASMLQAKYHTSLRGSANSEMLSSGDAISPMYYDHAYSSGSNSNATSVIDSNNDTNTDVGRDVKGTWKQKSSPDMNLNAETPSPADTTSDPASPTDDDTSSNNNNTSNTSDPNGSNTSSTLDTLTRVGHTLTRNAEKGLATVFQTGVKGLETVTDTLQLLTIGEFNENISSTAFVTFKSMVTTNTALQILLSAKYPDMVVHRAYSPRNIIWSNIEVGLKQIEARRTTAKYLVLMGVVFWSVVVSFIAGISNLDSLAEEYEWIRNYQDTWFYDILNAYLAAGIILLLLVLLPLIFDSISRYYECAKSESIVQKSILERYFYFQVANVYVSIASTSIFRSISNIANDPYNIFSILGESLPSASLYFCTLITTMTFTGLGFMFARIWPLIVTNSIGTFINKAKCTRRYLREFLFAAPRANYGWHYPSFLMVLMISFAYFTIAPVLILFSLTYFVVAYTFYKYQLLYVFVSPEESGGSYWFTVFSRSLVTAKLGALALMGYLAIKQEDSTITSGPFFALFPLPYMIGLFNNYCEKYKKIAKSISLEGCQNIDSDDTIHMDLWKKFNTKTFKQPVLSEPSFEPEAYRENSKGTHLLQGNNHVDKGIDHTHRRSNRSYSDVHADSDDGFGPMKKLTKNSSSSRNRASSVESTEFYSHIEDDEDFVERFLAE